MLGCVVGRSDEKLNATIKSLSSVSTFAFGGVGYAGVISQGEVDFKLVLSQPNSLALATFEKLFATGNAPAKAYALAGIKQLSQNRHRELLAIAKMSTDGVEVMRGCIIMHEPLGAVAKEIDDGEFHFRYRGNWQ